MLLQEQVPEQSCLDRILQRQSPPTGEEGRGDQEEGEDPAAATAATTTATSL